MQSAPPQDTVFIVDDDPAIRNSLGMLIEMVGLPVRSFPSAANFLDTYRPGDYGCLILDIRMPGINGLDLQRELIRRRIDIPIIMLTGFGNVPSAIRALKSGAIEFLEKPVDDDVLLDHVRRALTLDAEWRARQNDDGRIRDRIERLTEREREVLQLVVLGLSSKQVGHELRVTCKTWKLTV